jgi:hypothetical protein
MNGRPLLLAPALLGFFVLIAGLAEHESSRRVEIGLLLLACTPLLLAASSRVQHR